MQKTRWRAMLVVAGWVVVGVLGLASLVMLTGWNEWQLVDSPIWPMVAIVSGCVVVVFIVMRLRTGEWELGVLGFGVLVGGLVFVMGTFSLLPGVNAIFDDSRGRVRRAKVLDHWHHKNDTHRIVLEPWDGDADGEKFFVDEKVVEGDPTHVDVTTHEGALGFEWVSAIKPARAPAP